MLDNGFSSLRSGSSHFNASSRRRARAADLGREQSLDLGREERGRRPLPRHVAEDHADGVAWLRGNDAMLFPSPRNPRKAFYGFQQHWRKARELAGLWHPGDKDRQCKLHTLRHTCASHLVQAKVPLLDVSSVLGHSAIGVTQRYSHLESGAAADALRLVFGKGHGG